MSSESSQIAATSTEVFDGHVVAAPAQQPASRLNQILAVLHILFNNELSNEMKILIMSTVDFWGLFRFRHAHPIIFRHFFNSEAFIVESLFSIEPFRAARRIFKPLAFSHILRLKARCDMADKMAAFLTIAAWPLGFYGPPNVVHAQTQTSDPGSIQMKLNCYLLLLGGFLQSYRKQLAEYAGPNTTRISSHVLPECLQVEGQLLRRYTPHAIKMLIGMHDFLYAIVDRELNHQELGLNCGRRGTQFRFTEVFVLGQLELVCQLCSRNDFNGLDDIYGTAYDWAVSRIWQSMTTTTAPTIDTHSQYTYSIGFLPRPIVRPLSHRLGKKVLELLPKNAPLLQPTDLLRHGFPAMSTLRMDGVRDYFRNFILSDREDKEDLLLEGPRGIGNIEGSHRPGPGTLFRETRFREIRLSQRGFVYDCPRSFI